jgi:hypothetical protein
MPLTLDEARCRDVALHALPNKLMKEWILMNGNYGI